jgi:predicted DNA-binding transcriptional regulator YafY
VRADRLVATLLLLQARKRLTAAEVAAELEVSERTARRDLEALSAAGIPVYPQPGRGGGWELVGGARTDLSGLTADEARTLFMVAGPAADATPQLKAALRKLVRALPEPFRASAQTAASSIVIDPGGWGQTRHSRKPEALDALQLAVAAGVQVKLSYADRAGNPSTRVVHPLGLAVKGTVWYLVAGTDDGLRTFRVGRVKSVEQTGDQVDRPDGFDLAATWKRIVANVDELRSPHQVEAMADADVVPILRWMFERQLTVIDETGPDGQTHVSIGGHSIERITAQIAGFGARISVIAPEQARAEMARIGRELVGSYSANEGRTG